MPEFLEDPSVLTKEKLKSELVANNVTLPAGEQRKDVYVQLYLQHLTARNRPPLAAAGANSKGPPDFSSDEEREPTPVLASAGRGRAAAVGRVRAPGPGHKGRPLDGCRFPARSRSSLRGAPLGPPPPRRRGRTRALRRPCRPGEGREGGRWRGEPRSRGPGAGAGAGAGGGGLGSAGRAAGSVFGRGLKALRRGQPETTPGYTPLSVFPLSELQGLVTESRSAPWRAVCAY